jgi:outer membrane protein TolC
MRTTSLAVLSIAAWCSAAAAAEPRTLTLEQAVELAMRVDPGVAEARIAQDRTKLAVLRSQLDRFSFKVDGQLQELWNKTNIGGPAIFNCSVAGVSFQTDAATCAADGGVATRSSEQAPESTQGLFNLSAALNVPVFSGLRVESNVGMKQRLRDAAIVSVKQSRKDIALAVARAYWSVRRLGLTRDVQAAMINRLKEAEQVTDARLRAGLAPPIDKNRAVSRRLQQQAQLADLDGQIREASVQLAVLLGLSDDIVLVDQAVIPNAEPPPVDSLLDDAHHGRPELAVARLQAEAQHYAVRIARSNFFPQIGLFGLFQLGNNPFLVSSGARASSDAANPFSGMSGNLTLGATVNMNFFDTLNTWTGMKDALYEEDRLQAE